MIAARVFLSSNWVRWLLVAAITWIACGCQQSAELREYGRRIESTKANFKSSDVWGATKPLFVKFKPNSDIPQSDIPKEIVSLPFFPEGTNGLRVLWSGSETNGLMFVTGEGFRHYGIVIFEFENYEPTDNRLKRWGNGVYFYRD